MDRVLVKLLSNFTNNMERDYEHHLMAFFHDNDHEAKHIALDFFKAKYAESEDKYWDMLTVNMQNVTRIEVRFLNFAHTIRFVSLLSDFCVNIPHEQYSHLRQLMQSTDASH